MLQESFFIWESLLALLAFLADFACGLALPAALSLIIGRRGNARFCRDGAAALLLAALFPGVASFFYYPFSCYLVLAPYSGGPGFMEGFLCLPGLPWLSAWLAWLMGLVLLWLAWKSVPHVKIDAGDCYRLKDIRLPFFAALSASFCFFASFFLINWPFAGLPAELSLQRVLVAVSRNAFRHWFASLSLGGGLALALAPSFLRALTADAREKERALRWCAMWASACAIPSAFQNWGLLLGIMARGQSFFQGQPGAAMQFLAIVSATLALLCWLWCFWKKRSGPIAWLALFFMLVKTYAPVFGHAFMAGVAII